MMASIALRDILRGNHELAAIKSSDLQKERRLRSVGATLSFEISELSFPIPELKISAHSAKVPFWRKKRKAEKVTALYRK